MSTGLMKQLAEYGAFHDEEQGYVDVADIFESSSLPSEAPLLAIPRLSRRSGVWVAIAAAVITLLLAGLVPLLIYNDDQPAADTPVATNPVPTPTTVPLTTAGGTAKDPVMREDGGIEYPDGWIRYTDVELPRGVEPVWTGRELLAHDTYEIFTYETSRSGDSGLDSHTTIWRSTNGANWSAVDVGGHSDDPSVRGPWVTGIAGHIGLRELGNQRLVAVGFEFIFEDEPPRASAFDDNRLGRGVVWTSADGAEWTRLDHQPAFDAAEVRAVAQAEDGTFVAVGYTYPRRDEQGVYVITDPVAWVSPDGLVWDRIDLPNADVHPEGLIAVETWNGGFVAVGDTPGGPPHASVLWLSADGREWTRVELPTGSLEIEAIASNGEMGLVALGIDCWTRCQPAIWFSLDGFDWDVAFRFGGNEGAPAPRPSDLIATHEVAVCQPFSPCGADLVAVGGDQIWMSSTDGIGWSPYEFLEFGAFTGGGMNSISRFGDGYIILGDGEVWIHK